MSGPRHSAELSHEIPAGPSGPARSYWDFTAPSDGDSKGVKLGTICLHHSADTDASLTANSICWMLDKALEAGRVKQAATIRSALNYGRKRP